MIRFHKHYDDDARQWVGVIVDHDNQTVLDVNRTATEAELDAWAQQAIATRPWETRQ